MLIDKLKYKSSLSDLWHRVFGDDYSFIDLIFKKEYESCILCFAHLAEERAVSSFYLIENTLKFDGKLYKGYYLYAAATLLEYRKEGLMSKLINEALVYCKNKGADYVSLVPSEQSLYSYYSRFGFVPAMYRYVNSRNDVTGALIKADRLNIDEIIEIRNKFEGNVISYNAETFDYAAACLGFYGLEFNRLSRDGYLLSTANGEFSELFSSKTNLDENLLKIRNVVKRLTSPFSLEGFNDNTCVPYGMIFPINPPLKRDWKFTDIYMDIALD